MITNECIVLHVLTSHLQQWPVYKAKYDGIIRLLLKITNPFSFDKTILSEPTEIPLRI